MINKDLINKFYLFLVIICGLTIFTLDTVIAATNVNVIQKQHENVEVNKVWRIKFNQGINVDKLSANVVVYNPIGISAKVKISYDVINNVILVEPPTDGYIPGQTYSLHIYDTIKDLKGNTMKDTVIKNFTIKVLDNGPKIDSYNKVYNYIKYNTNLEKMIVIQSKDGAVNLLPKYELNASDMDIYEYLNPKNFENHDYAVYQFLTLNYIEGITAEELDNVLKGNGILEGKGKIFLDACKKYNINPAYIISHAILETGHGSSVLANGIVVNKVAGIPVKSKKTYNMFGIGAFDEDANKYGSERAYNLCWFTPEAAIDGGIKWISDMYINNNEYKQNTLYKMRWNPAMPGVHQYATDIAWAYQQSYKIKEILDKCSNANLKFEIPQYK